MECGGRVCIGTLPLGVFAGTGTTAEDTEGLVDYARSIDGVDIGVLIEERPDGAVKASLRAKDPLCRLDLVAAQFGGGGHACAAGLNLKTGRRDFRDAPARGPSRGGFGSWTRSVPSRGLAVP